MIGKNMDNLKVGSLIYKLGLRGKVFYQAHNGDWLLSPNQQDIIDKFTVIHHLKKCGHSTIALIAKELRWTKNKVKTVCAQLYNLCLIYRKNGKIFPDVTVLVN